MKKYESGIKLSIYMNEGDKVDRMPLYEHLVLKAKELGIAGATVLRGVMGYGSKSQIHSAKILRLAEELPMVVEIIDTKGEVSMEESGEKDLISHFSVIRDPRIERTRRHKLEEIIVIAVCGVICGADSWIQIEAFGKAKVEWLRGFLELPHGIPSHDTFGRVFCLLRPEAFRECFLNWIQAVAEITQGNIIAIDGKTLRRSYDRQDGKEAIHMVSAWSNQNHLVLGQIKTNEKSNEITAIPKLLKMLDVKGCIVTLDAMGTQKEIAKKIIEGGGDYVCFFF